MPLSSRALLIGGMHRSGTSLLASWVQAAGVSVGERLHPPGQGNPRGHFEDAELMAFHQGVLERRGFTPFRFPEGWQPCLLPDEHAEAAALVARRAHLERWAFKDPRSALFLELWGELLPDPCFLFVYRHPVEVVLSLGRRHHVVDREGYPHLAVRSWIEHNRRLLDWAKRHPSRCLLWNLEALVAAPGEAFAELAARFAWPPLANAAPRHHPSELRLGRAAAELDWQAVWPDALALYAELERRADRPARGAPPSLEGAVAAERATAERILWTVFQEPSRATPAPTPAPPPGPPDPTHLARLGERARLLAQIERTRGFRLLDTTWRLRRILTAAAKGAWPARDPRPIGTAVTPHEVEVACAVSADAADVARAVRLVRSLRAFGGSLAGCRVRAYLPAPFDEAAARHLLTAGADVEVLAEEAATSVAGQGRGSANTLRTPAPPPAPTRAWRAALERARRDDVPYLLLLRSDLAWVGDPHRWLARDAVTVRLLETTGGEPGAADRRPAARTGVRTLRPGDRAAPALLGVPRAWMAPLLLAWERQLATSSAGGEHDPALGEADLGNLLAASGVPVAPAPLALLFPTHLAPSELPRAAWSTVPRLLEYAGAVDGVGQLREVVWPHAARRIRQLNALAAEVALSPPAGASLAALAPNPFGPSVPGY
jgi:hypothetical protein